MRRCKVILFAPVPFSTKFVLLKSFNCVIYVFLTSLCFTSQSGCLSVNQKNKDYCSVLYCNHF